MRKILSVSLSIFLFLLFAFANTSISSAEDEQVIHTGVLGFLGTTETRFQEGLDLFRTKIPSGYQERIYGSGFVKSLRTEKREIHFFGSLMRMVMNLRSGKVDEIMLPEDVGRYITNLNSEIQVKYVSEVFSSRISFAFRKENAELKAEFDRAILEMKKDGTIDELSKTFIHTVNPKPVRPEHFKEAETITVAVTGDMPPIDMFAGDGKPAGYNTAILAEIGKRLKKNIRLLNIEAAARNSALTSGRADVVFWYRTVKIEIGDAKIDNSVFIDAPDEIILSEPYYSWNREFILKMSDRTGFWGLFKRK